MTDPDPTTETDSEETRRVTLTGELQGDLTGTFTAEATIPSDVAEPEPPKEADDRYAFTGESFAVRSTAHTPPMQYAFTVDEVLDAESLEDADSYEETEDGRYRVEGTIGPRGSDTYSVEGKLADWAAEHNETGDAVPQTRYEVTVAGERHELHTLLDEPEPESDDTGPEAIGGGEYYSQTVTADDADAIVDSHDDLRDALADAESGDVVFVDGDAELYSPSKDERYVVTAGVTLASDRGVDGAAGALLHTDAAYSYGAHGLVSVRGDDARVTGIRVRGPHPDPSGGWREHSYDYEMGAVNARTHGAERLEVDNCELWGFAHLVVSGTDGHVHHNHLHHANMEGLGYCTSIGSTEGTIFEYNYCEHWRHVIAGSGGGGYEARFNSIDGPARGHTFDQHSPGGTYSDIHHNTCRVGDDVAHGDPFVPFATFRGSNARNAEVYKNWAYNTMEPRENPSGSFTDEFITHPKHGGTGWTDIEWWDNHLGTDEPDDPDIGCPR